MLNFDFVSTLLEASIAGAGLVLAFIALMTSFAGRIFTDRATASRHELEEVKQKISEVGPDASSVQIKELKDRLDRVEEQLKLPQYLDWTALAAFSCYVASALISFAWLYSWQRPMMDWLLGPVFLFSTFIFLVTGADGIWDIRRAMKRQFDELKKKAEEAKRKTGTYA